MYSIQEAIIDELGASQPCTMKHLCATAWNQQTEWNPADIDLLQIQCCIGNELAKLVDQGKVYFDHAFQAYELI